VWFSFSLLRANKINRKDKGIASQVKIENTLQENKKRLRVQRNDCVHTEISLLSLQTDLPSCTAQGFAISRLHGKMWVRGIMAVVNTHQVLVPIARQRVILNNQTNPYKVVGK
jgi:hypothetical protein